MADAFANVHALILAAGASRRLGRPKQLELWQGQSLLARALDGACRVLPGRVVVVLGAEAEPIRGAVDLQAATVVLNPNWQEGIAASIRCGVEALPASAAAVLMMLCDQPLVDAGHLAALLNAWRIEPERIVASRYGLSCGVPAVFPVSYFERLQALRGDRGAKALLLEEARNVREIACARAEVDIDTQDDVERLSGQALAEE